MKSIKLIQNIIDQIKEAQLKLGYVEETIRLYFPRESINSILHTDYAESESLLAELQKDPIFSKSILGELSFRLQQNRIEVRIPPQGAKYVKENIQDPVFLKEFIDLFAQNHHLTIDEIQGCFERFSSDYICEKMGDDNEFDYVVYFVDESIDAYRYCIKTEMGHTVYHRFTKEDYERLIS